MAFHNDLGDRGEMMAVDFVRDKGYQILETNWRYRRSEVDIIARDGEVLVFVEVKTRSDNYFGNPETFVTAHKIKMLYDAASAYAMEVDHPWEVRFDIISVMIPKDAPPTIEHFVDAFYPGWEDGK